MKVTWPYCHSGPGNAVGVCPDQKAIGIAASDSMENPTPDEMGSVEQHDRHGVVVPPSSTTALFAAIVAGGLYWLTNGLEPEMNFSSGLAATQQYEGQWRFKEGLGLLPEDADARSFTITPLGFGSLYLKGVTGNLTLSLNQDGRIFSSLLFMMRESGGMGRFSARVRFSPEGNALTMSIVNYQIGGRQDIILEAEKIATN